jgi:hypothetical protein
MDENVLKTNQEYKLNELNDIVEEIWKTVTDDFRQVKNIKEVRNLNIDQLLNEAEQECKIDVEKCLSIWIVAYKLCIVFIYRLHELIFNCYQNNKELPNSIFLLTGKICSLLVADMKLLCLGHEDNARIITRTLIDTIELAIVALLDNTFDVYSMSDGKFDEKKFWEENIAYGKIHNRIKPALQKVGFDKESINDYILSIKKIKKVLSESVHPTKFSLFRSTLIPSLRYNDQLSLNVFGHISSHTCSHMSTIIEQIYRFASIIMQSIMLKEPLPYFKNATKVGGLNNVSVSFFVLQEYIMRYDEQLYKNDFENDAE